MHSAATQLEVLMVAWICHRQTGSLERAGTIQAEAGRFCHLMN